MTEAKRIMTMDDFEHRLLVGCINKARTEYMEEGKAYRGYKRAAH